MAIRPAPRRTGGPALKRTTVALPADLLEAADLEVAKGRAASRSGLLADALEAELRRREEEAIDAAFRLVLDDEDYRNEAERIMKEFDSADRETWAMIEE